MVNDGKISETMPMQDYQWLLSILDTYIKYISYLSQVRATTIRMDALITVSEMTILASQAYSPKGQGYWFHIRYSSEGMPQ